MVNINILNQKRIASYVQTSGRQIITHLLSDQSGNANHFSLVISKLLQMLSNNLNAKTYRSPLYQCDVVLEKELVPQVG